MYLIYNAFVEASLEIGKPFQNGGYKRKNPGYYQNQLIFNYKLKEQVIIYVVLTCG